MQSPTVSIIIPVYNGVDYLKRSIDSALNQTYKKIEVIVINDGSNDNNETEKIALSYGDKIRYFKKENGGVSSALNFGINKMNGEYFSWLSHDDIYHKDKTLKQVEELLKFETEKIIIMSNTKLINKNDKNIRTIKSRFKHKTYSAKKMFDILIRGVSVNGCSLLISKEAFEQIGYFDEELKYIQDWKMWVYLAMAGYSFHCLKEELVSMRIHDKQQTILLKGIFVNEKKKFIQELSDNLMIEDKNKDKLLKIVYLCVKAGFFEIKTKILSNLKETDRFSLVDYILYYSKIPFILFAELLRRNIKRYLNRKRRKNSKKIV